MRSLIAALALMASPALATGIEIQVEGENVKGTIAIDLLEDVAPKHAERIALLASEGTYNGVVFHRVIEGFMAQTGDVQNGRLDGDMRYAGTGGSTYGDLPAEFSDVPFDRGMVGMARSQSINSANSQFFIMFEDGHFLNGQYTVVGRVISGLDVLDKLKRGHARSGKITGQPDVMVSVSVTE